MLKPGQHDGDQGQDLAGSSQLVDLTLQGLDTLRRCAGDASAQTSAPFPPANSFTQPLRAAAHVKCMDLTAATRNEHSQMVPSSRSSASTKTALIHKVP